MKTINSMPNNAALQGYSTVPATSDAKEYLNLLLKHKLGLLAMLLLGILLASLYLMSATPVYEASALVEVKEQEVLGGENDNTPDWNAPTVKEEANIIKSRKVLTPVVELHDLRKSIQPRRVPVLGDLTQRIPALASWLSGFGFASKYAWGSEKLAISRLEVPSQWEDRGMVLTSLGDGFYSLEIDGKAIVDRAEIGESLLVQLDPYDPLEIVVTQLRAPVGVQFDVVKHSLQETLSALQGDLQTETSDSKSRMINLKLRGKDAVETSEVLNAIAEKYRDIKAGAESKPLQASLTFFETALPKVTRELEEAEAALARFRNRTGTIDQPTQVRAKLDQLSKLESQLIDLQIEKDELGKRYSNLHPSTKRLDKKIDVLEAQIRRTRGQVGTAPNRERELKSLEEREATARLLFNETNQKLQKARLIEAGQVDSVQIWDTALVPKKPISPKPLLAIVGATIGTLFLYIVYLTLRSALTTVITDQESLERASGLPVFINIPRSAAQRRIANRAPVDPSRLLASDGANSSPADKPLANVLAVQKPEDYSVENMRGLRLMLEDVLDGAPNNVLMICSPLPNMGKSFVSANLSVLLAQSGKRVLLIDADYQRGQLHKNFGLHMGPGLPEVVRGKSELKETVKATSVPNLYAIPRGFSSSGGETPSNKEFGAFLQVVAPRFDMVIIDTPPILSVSTAATLGRHAGSSFMVVKEGEIKEPQLNEALKRLSFSGVRVNGCLMNGSSTPTPSHYAYYREQLD